MKKYLKGIHKNVILTGITSFFTDISSEMIYPVLQSFIKTVLYTQAQLLGPVIGIIEGIAESTASLLKVFSGYYSDYIKNRKFIAIAGYGISVISKVLFFFPSWTMILLARFFDRVGKGIRSAPRDAIITESTSKEFRGKAFGLQRAMDFFGASIGSILSVILIKFLFPNIEKLTDPKAFFPFLFIALIPAALGVFALFFIKEKEQENDMKNGITIKGKAKPSLKFWLFDKNLQLFYIVQIIFTLGNSSNQFLILRSTSLGYILSTVIIMYIVFNFTTSIFSTYFGSLSDRIGRKRLLVIGYLLYAIVYTGFGILSPNSKELLWVLWIVYGFYYAMTEGVEKAFIADRAPAESRATALGIYNTLIGVMLLPASLLAGFLYGIEPSMPFILGGVLSLCAVIVLIFIKKN